MWDDKPLSPVSQNTCELNPNFCYLRQCGPNEKKNREGTHTNTHTLTKMKQESDDEKTSSQWANTSLVPNVPSTDNDQGGFPPTTRRWNLRWTRRIGYQGTRSTLHFTVRWKSVSSEHDISYLHNYNRHTKLKKKKTHINASSIHSINASYIHSLLNASYTFFKCIIHSSHKTHRTFTHFS